MVAREAATRKAQFAQSKKMELASRQSANSLYKLRSTMYYAALAMMFFGQNIRATIKSLIAPAYKATGIFDVLSDLLSVLVLQFLVPYLPFIYSVIIGIFNAIQRWNLGPLVGKLVVYFDMFVGILVTLFPIFILLLSLIITIGGALVEAGAVPLEIIIGLIALLVVAFLAIPLAIIFCIEMILSLVDAIKSFGGVIGYLNSMLTNPIGTIGTTAKQMPNPGQWVVNQYNNYTGGGNDFDQHRQQNQSQSGLAGLVGQLRGALA